MNIYVKYGILQKINDEIEFKERAINFKSIFSRVVEFNCFIFQFVDKGFKINLLCYVFSEVINLVLVWPDFRGQNNEFFNCQWVPYESFCEKKVHNDDKQQ